MIDGFSPRRFWLIAIVAGVTLALGCWLALVAVASLFGVP